MQSSLEPIWCVPFRGAQETGNIDRLIERAMTTNCGFELQRFVHAQESVFEQVCAELRGGQKVTHWIWFIFPQMRGLGNSSTANEFGISSRAEADAYLRHQVLGPRLRECTRLVNLIEGRSIEVIFPFPDNLKFRSSMTLFAQLQPDNDVFTAALKKYYHGQPDQMTLDLLKS